MRKTFILVTTAALVAALSAAPSFAQGPGTTGQQPAGMNNQKQKVPDNTAGGVGNATGSAPGSNASAGGQPGQGTTGSGAPGTAGGGIGGTGIGGSSTGSDSNSGGSSGGAETGGGGAGGGGGSGN